LTRQLGSLSRWGRIMRGTWRPLEKENISNCRKKAVNGEGGILIKKKERKRVDFLYN